jgi:hypothetical protein
MAMDRIEKPKGSTSEFANQGEIPRLDPAENDTVTGREDHFGITEAGSVAASEIKKPIGAHPRSEVTGAHDSGSGANETIDGFTDSEEALRQAAEDTPSGQTPVDEDMPVFDRANDLPRI